MLTAMIKRDKIKCLAATCEVLAVAASNTVHNFAFKAKYAASAM